MFISSLNLDYAPADPTYTAAGDDYNDVNDSASLCCRAASATSIGSGHHHRRRRAFPLGRLGVSPTVLIALSCTSQLVWCVAAAPPPATTGAESSSDISYHTGAPDSTSRSDYYFRLCVCAVLVLTGGLLAGLTLGLMSLDETNLHILATSGTPTQRQYAKRIQPIRKNGHWLLVTLLLGNTIVNETLPIVMDSIFGGGVAAVLISTASIVIFGEIIPQAVCARFGLAIGAFFAWPVRILQWVIAPLGYPIAMLLDWILGADHGITYKKAELKELVSLSDTAHGGSLSKDEVTIIRGALDLSEKLVVDVMTDLNNVYMIDANSCLDRSLMTEILRRGHSRVPVYEHSRDNIIGVLLVKSLILLDPDDSVPVRDVKILPIPSVTPDISLYDILNTFQEGGSHMAIVVDGFSDLSSAAAALGQQPPGATGHHCNRRSRSRRRKQYYNRIAELNGGRAAERSNSGVPLGVITLEDVIEELIQEEIIDETDVFVDIRNRVKVVRAVSHGRPTETLLRAGADQWLVSDTNTPPSHPHPHHLSQVPSQPLSLRSTLGTHLVTPSASNPPNLETGMPGSTPAPLPPERERGDSVSLVRKARHLPVNAGNLVAPPSPATHDFSTLTPQQEPRMTGGEASGGHSRSSRRVRRGMAFSARRRAQSLTSSSSSDEQTPFFPPRPENQDKDGSDAVTAGLRSHSRDQDWSPPARHYGSVNSAKNTPVVNGRTDTADPTLTTGLLDRHSDSDNHSV